MRKLQQSLNDERSKSQLKDELNNANNKQITELIDSKTILSAVENRLLKSVEKLKSEKAQTI